MKTVYTLLTTLLFLSNPACGSVKKAARETGYSAYELVGIQKRDILKKRVDEVKDEQKEASESFGNALEEMKKITGFKGGELEDRYDSLKDAYDDANKRAQEVSQSINKIETVSGDLFDEWEKEIGEMKTASLRSRSQETLNATKKRYRDLHSNLKRSEKSMSPVLSKLNDQVLYLKHNLNAQAITSLKGESANIQADIERLIKDMNSSIAAADQFIAQME